MPESRYVDAAALLVLTTASLRAGQALHPTGTWEPVGSAPTCWSTARTTAGSRTPGSGSRSASGTQLLSPTQGCVRCTRVTREQPGLDADREVFRTLARHHGGRSAPGATSSSLVSWPSARRRWSILSQAGALAPYAHIAVQQREPLSTAPVTRAALTAPAMSIPARVVVAGHARTPRHSRPAGLSPREIEGDPEPSAAVTALESSDGGTRGSAGCDALTAGRARHGDGSERGQRPAGGTRNASTCPACPAWT